MNRQEHANPGTGAGETLATLLLVLVIAAVGAALLYMIWVV